MHPSALAKRVYLLLFAILIAFYFYGIGRLPLLGPDEPRYAQIAREMFLTGDLITPTLGGHTWFEKPALLYWMIAAAFKVLGVSEWSARLGPAVCGVLTVVAVWTVGRKIDLGFSGLLVTATCLGLIVFSRAASFDVVITMTTTWALALFILHEIRRKRLLLIGFYTLVGLSLLAKGLVGIVIPFGVVGLYYIFRRGAKAQRRAFLLSLTWGIPLALAVAAIWYGPVIAKHGWSFIDDFFVQHHFARYTSNKYHHPQPIYFYPAIILMFSLPWTPFLIESLFKARRWEWRGNDRLHIVRVFSLAWLVFPILFFSFSGSKLPGYVLPALPAAALLIADVLRQRKPALPISIACATIALVLIALLSGVAEKIAKRESARDLLALADARGYANAPVLAQRSDDRSAEFYAYGRVIYEADGEPLTFDKVSVAEARARGRRFVVLIPVQYVENFRATPGIEVIGDNGHTAILGWNP